MTEMINDREDCVGAASGTGPALIGLLIPSSTVLRWSPPQLMAQQVRA